MGNVPSGIDCSRHLPLVEDGSQTSISSQEEEEDFGINFSDRHDTDDKNCTCSNCQKTVHPKELSRRMLAKICKRMERLEGNDRNDTLKQSEILRRDENDEQDIRRFTMTGNTQSSRTSIITYNRSIDLEHKISNELLLLEKRETNIMMTDEILYNNPSTEEVLGLNNEEEIRIHPPSDELLCMKSSLLINNPSPEEFGTRLNMEPGLQPGPESMPSSPGATDPRLSTELVEKVEKMSKKIDTTAMRDSSEIHYNSRPKASHPTFNERSVSQIKQKDSSISTSHKHSPFYKRPVPENGRLDNTMILESDADQNLDKWLLDSSQIKIQQNSILQRAREEGGDSSLISADTGFASIRESKIQQLQKKWEMESPYQPVFQAKDSEIFTNKSSKESDNMKAKRLNAPSQALFNHAPLEHQLCNRNSRGSIVFEFV